jgi:hypothetical protein
MQDAVEQVQDAMVRTSQGQGSVGMFLHDPELAEELRQVAAKASKLLTHRHKFRFVIDIGVEQIPAYTLSNSRAYFNLGIWPAEDRYYLFGFAQDPRGMPTVTNTTTTDSNGNTTETYQSQMVETGFVFTGMLGKVFFEKRLDLSVGVLYGDLDVSVAGNIGPRDHEDRIRLRSDFYSHGIGAPSEIRVDLILRPVPALYVQGGIDGYHAVDNRVPWLYGAGITFTDDDIKFLFETYLSNAI